MIGRHILQLEPATSTGRIARPELTHRLSTALKIGSLLLVAGPGYGKTTAVEEALAARRSLSLKLALTEEDRSAGFLIGRLLSGLREVLPGAVDVLADRVALGTEPVDIAAVRRQLVADLDRLLVDPLVVFFDDAEVIADAPQALAIVRDLIAAESECLRVAVASRRPLGMRVAKLVGAERLVEVGEEELLLTVDECERLLRARWQRDPTQDELRAVLEATAGWPLGVALAARAGPDADPLDLSMPEELHSFLAEEVLDNVDPELRAALVEASVVRAIDPTVVAALGLPKDFIERVESQRLLVQPAPGGFRFHPLFRDFLRTRLVADRSEAELRDLHRRAALGLEETGRGAEAVEHWIAAGATEEAVSSVVREGRALVRSAPEVVGGWIDQLPPEVTDDPGLLSLRGQLAFAEGDLESADELLGLASSAHRRAGDPVNDWAARFERALVFYFVGNYEAVGRLVEDFEPSAPGCAHPAALATVFYAAGGLAAYGKFAASEAIMARAAGHAAFTLMAPLDAMRGAYVDIPGGELDAAMGRIESAVEALRRSDPMGQLSYLLAAGALVRGDQGRDREALEWWQWTARAGEESGQALTARAARAWSATYLARSGRLAEAERELTYAGDRQLAGWRRYDVELARATIAAKRGEGRIVLERAERAIEFVATGPPSDHVWVATGLGPLLVDAGHEERARTLLEETLAHLDAFLPGPGGRYWRARLLAHRAWIKARNADQAGADADFDSASEQAGEAFNSLLRSCWRQVEGLVWSALERGALEPSRTIAAFRGTWPHGTPLVRLLDHPTAEVRRLALPAAVASGNPEASARLAKLAEDPDPSVAAVAAAARDGATGSAPPLIYRLLGRFEVHRGPWLIEQADWGRPVASRLVRYLLIQRERAIPEEQLFDALWRGKESVAARRALQVALSRARAVLDPAAAEASRLEVVDRTYRLRLLEGDLVDVDEFEAAVSLVTAEQGEGRLALLERVDQLWTGEPLPEDRYEDWAIAWRGRLTDRFLGVLVALAHEHSGRGDQPGAIHALQRIIELDPVYEGAHRDLIKAYARSGRPAHALRQYLECRRAMTDELGVEPSQETTRLQTRILAGETV